MNRQPILENDLIRIRPMTSEDQEPLYQIAKDPLIWEQHHVKRYRRDVFQKFFKDSMDSGGAFIIEDPSTDQIIGSSRYQSIEGFPDGIEIGWTFLARSYWGGRYNRAVKQLMMEHAFKYVSYVVLYIHQKNIRSQKAAEKIGAKRLTKSEWSKIPRKNPDTLIYLLSRD